MSIKFVELTGSPNAIPAGVQGHANPNDEMVVTVHLHRKRPEAEFQEFLRRLDAGLESPLTQSQFRRRFGANRSAADAVVRFYSSQYGLTVDSVDLGARTVNLRGQRDQITKAFQTNIHDVKHTDGQTYQVRTTGINIPSHLQRHIKAVLGLTTLPRVRSHHRKLIERLIGGHDDNATRKSYFAREVLKAFGIDLGTDGTGETIFIGELGGGNRPSDNVAFAKKRNLPPLKVTYPSIDGATNAYDPPNDANGEVELDVQIPYDAIPGAKFEVGFAPNSGQGFANLVLYFAHKSKAFVMTLSWGMSEDSWDDQERGVMDSSFEDCAAMGKIVTASMGDDGSSDGQNDGKAHTDYPAIHPRVLGIGGIYLEVDANGVLTLQIVWNNGAGRGATGGGVSIKYAKPDYQNAIQIVRAGDGHVGRIGPDVGAVGDPRSGFMILVDGKWMAIGGTSAGSPFWAMLLVAVNARRVKAGKKRLSSVHAFIYAHGDLFRHVEQGDNGDYKAEKGVPFNACCGWGTPTKQLFDALIAA